MRSFMLLGMVFICDFGVLGGKAAFPREGGGVRRGGRGGYCRNVDEMGSQDPALNQTEEQLRIPTEGSQSLLLIYLLGLVLVVLVNGWLCGGREAKEVFFSPFSAGSARNSRPRLIGAVQISTPPDCKGERRWIPQNTIARKVLLSVHMWQSITFLSISTGLLSALPCFWWPAMGTQRGTWAVVL